MHVNVGKGIELEIDATALPQAAMDHVVMIGLRNVLMDSHASITADEYPDPAEREAAARAMVDKKLAALMSGEVRVASGRTSSADPVRAEAMNMALVILKGKIRAAGKKVGDYEAKAIREAAAKLITPELLAKAAERVAETKAIDTGDLAELGL